MSLEWMSWRETPWMARTQPQRGLVQFCETAVATSRTAGSGEDFLKNCIPDALAELGADWCGLFGRTPEWSTHFSQGRQSPDSLPGELLSEVDDSRSGCFASAVSGDERPCLLIPVEGTKARVIGFWGRGLTSDLLPAAHVLGRAVSAGLSVVESCHDSAQRVARLKSTLEIAQTFSQEREPQPLLERIAEESTRLFDCDRASIFIWDQEARQLMACPALGVEGGTLWLPDNRGIVGDVIQNGDLIRVDDAYSDSRFDQSVDKASGYHTRTLLCVPLSDANGRRIGAFELINKNDGVFTPADEEGLVEFGRQAAISIQNSREREQLVRSNRELTAQVTGGTAIIGESAAIVALHGTIERLAETDLPVLILGESGTGKEVAAQALHYRGSRAERPFIAVNCAALTETLLESELFGHEKGAFTDAHQMQKGKFELADGGTLFLDEIGDMSVGGQAKLLRVLEQKVITRVGGSQSIPINVRVIAATNADLAGMVSSKRFRQDLYYRLSVVTVEIPALRERPEDVIPLAEFFLEKFCRQANKKTLELAPDARRRLQAHAWPGNVRELRNLMERVAFLTKGERVEANDIAFILSPQQDAFDDLAEGVGLTEATARFQQEYIRRAVKRVRGNMSDAARILGLHRSNLYRKMRQLGMDVSDKP